MPFVIPVAVAIAASVAAAAAAVAAVVATVVTAVAAAVAAAATWVWGAVTVAYAAVSTAVADLALGYSTYALGTSTLVDYVGTSLFTQIGAYASSLVSTFGGFLEAIHFKTILAIHQIASVVSDDYRAMWVNVYSEMGKISYALGYSADFLNIIIRDSRNVVLDASAMMGQKYDLAEITWMKSFQDYIKVFSDQAKAYTKNPAAVFYDIDKMLTKPAVDNKAAIMQTVYSTIESTIKFTKAVVDQTDKLRIDLGKLISDLPEQIRGEVKPLFDRVTKDFADWVQGTYKPSLKVLDSVISTLGIKQDVAAASARELAARLKKPGDYLREIDKLPRAEREDQEGKITEITLRPWVYEAGVFREITDAAIAERQESIRRLEAPTERAAWAIPELEAPERPAATPVEPRKTWFVGDF